MFNYCMSFICVFTPKFGSVLRKTAGLFRFGFEKPSVCRSVVKYKKRVNSVLNCLSCVHILHFGRRFSNPRFHDHSLSDSVRNVKNIEAL